jgi:hypothetical protein
LVRSGVCSLARAWSNTGVPFSTSCHIRRCLRQSRTAAMGRSLCSRVNRYPPPFGAGIGSLPECPVRAATGS